MIGYVWNSDSAPAYLKSARQFKYKDGPMMPGRIAWNMS